MKAVVIATVFGCLCSGAQTQTVSPLFARGYTVIPEPQKVVLGAKDFPFDQSWHLRLDKSVPSNEVAVEALREDLSTRFNVRLKTSGTSRGVVSLSIVPGSIQTGHAQDNNKSALEQQAYRITLHSGAITITANASTGLFYGVETFIQLLRSKMGTLWLPEGTIEDWPDLELRQIYWDNDFHLDRIDALKHDMRQAAFYKINGFVLKLNGHFQYKSALAVVEPYALMPSELQDLTNFGLRYHVQLIPYLDGPAHLSFILKHPEYAKLREFPNNNYEICATNAESYKLLDGMYQELLDANQGVKYFYLSTDEPYYVGLAHNSQCDEADLARQLGSVGQVLSRYVEQAGGYLHNHGRTVMFWGEYPLIPSDISSLPAYLVNGEVYGPDADKAFHRRGIRQMIYTSTEGEEYLFPDYSLLPRKEHLHPDNSNAATEAVDTILNKISFDSSRENTNLIGEVNAGWGDQGVNPETMWIGYVASDAAGWHPGSPSAPELANTFYALFYGPTVVNMDRIYQLMSEQAQSWSDSWDWMPSKARGPIFGNSDQIYKTTHLAKDQILPLPPSPDSNLNFMSTWSSENARRVALASQANHVNANLLSLLHENILRSQFNQYNLAVFVTIANLCRQNFAMILGIHDMDVDLMAASELKGRDPKAAVDKVDNALDVAISIWQKRNEVLQNSTATWDKSWFPRVAAAHGRDFLYEPDDVQDYPTDRTVDMSYLVYREKLLPFGSWVNSILESRNKFAAAHDLPARAYSLAWDDFSVVSPGRTIIR